MSRQTVSTQTVSTQTMSAQLVDRGNGQFSLQGLLDFASVPALLVDSVRAFAPYREITVDLAGVENTNSAGMALLLEWRAQFAAGGKSLKLTQLPHNLRQIAQVCEVENLLLGDGVTETETA